MPSMSIVREIPAAQPPARPLAIKVVALEKTYATHDGGRVQALGPISVEVEQGGFMTIVGPSGCGKSTLLKMLSGLLKRSAGSLKVGGVEVHEPQRNIGMVFQSPVLLPWKNAVENVLLPAKVLGLDMAASRKRAHELLEMVGLKDFAHKYPPEL